MKSFPSPPVITQPRKTSLQSTRSSPAFAFTETYWILAVRAAKTPTRRPFLPSRQTLMYLPDWTTWIWSFPPVPFTVSHPLLLSEQVIADGGALVFFIGWTTVAGIAAAAPSANPAAGVTVKNWRASSDSTLAVRERMCGDLFVWRTCFL